MAIDVFVGSSFVFEVYHAGCADYTVEPKKIHLEDHFNWYGKWFKMPSY